MRKREKVGRVCVRECGGMGEREWGRCEREWGGCERESGQKEKVRN